MRAGGVIPFFLPPSPGHKGVMVWCQEQRKKKGGKYLMHARYYTGWIKVPNLIPKNKRKRTKNNCFIFKGIFTHFDAPTLCGTQFASSFNVNGKLEDSFFCPLAYESTRTCILQQSRRIYALHRSISQTRVAYRIKYSKYEGITRPWLR